MRALRYIILALLLLNLPSAALEFVSAGLGEMLSYGSLLLLIVHYILEERGKPITWLILIGFTYYLIGSFQYIGQERPFIISFIKFFIVIITGTEVMKRTSKKDLFVFLFLGAVIILSQALFFPTQYGRYQGFYGNPNTAGFICISGYGLTYGLTNRKMALLGQFVFTLIGLLTFSRTFIVIWVLINLLSLFISFKNIKIFLVGFLIVSTLFVIDEVVGLNNPRFAQLKAIVTNENVSTSEVSQGSRTETWARFYDAIIKKPVFGNGYGAFQGGGIHHLGAHNSYLLTIGEAGIIPFLLFVSFFIAMVYRSALLFKKSPNLLMQSIAISIFLMANHNFFNFYYIVMLAIWIYVQISTVKETELELLDQ